MPVWYEKTRELVANGELVLLGITQEQHPDRCALFAQWQGFDFPILWDPFGVAGLEVVPVVTAIDEHGVVRVAGPDLRQFDAQFVEGFVRTQFEAPPATATRPAGFRLSAALAGSERERALGVLLTRANDAEARAAVDAAVATLDAYAGVDPVAGFHAGVAHRLRYDGPAARPEDFQAAADLWRTALRARPNQYIWRRRIQQWGPRLDKPYPFYDWVATATAEVRAGGQEPVALRVPLSGSEIAAGLRGAAPNAPAERSLAPDAEARVTRDAGQLVRIEVAVLAHTGSTGPGGGASASAARVHVTLRPQGGAIHWGLDADPPQVWLEPGGGWSATRALVDFAYPSDRPAAEAEQAPLRADFGLAQGAGAAAKSVRGYAVYSVCLEDGRCVYRRQDFEIEVGRD